MSLPTVNGFIALSQITCISSKDGKIIVQTCKGKSVLLKNLGELLILLEPLGFAQIDQSNIVNIEFIDFYDEIDNKIILKCKPPKSCNVSRRNMKKINQIMRLKMKK